MTKDAKIMFEQNSFPEIKIRKDDTLSQNHLETALNLC